MPIVINRSLKKALFFGIGYAVLVSILAVLVKLATPYATNSMTVFFRFTFSIIYISGILGISRMKGQKIPVTTQHLGMHIFRAFAAFAGQFSLFFALRHVPVVSTMLLSMTYPLFIPILGAIFFRQKTGGKNWLAIIVGFIGITLVLKPGIEIFNPIALFALLSGFCSALSFLGIHELGKYDPPHTIMFFYFILTFLFSSILILFNWQTPDYHAFILLLLIGIIGTLGQECSIRALVNAPAKLVAPLMYLVIPFSTLLSWFIWHQFPDLFSWLGMILVSLGSISTVLKTQQKTEKI
jgi:drug/metabolite transporter (DMT)-like permease